MEQIDRTKFIGGSDIGAIIGVSKWRTPLDVYLMKRGEMPMTGGEADAQKEKVLRRGKRMEPVVLEMLGEEKQLKIVARNERYVDQEYPYMACEIDAEADLDGERVNVEIKTSHPFAAGQWGEEGTDEIDVSYAAQAMWGLMITGRPRCIFGVLIGSDNLLSYEIKRDDETIASMRAKAVEFWEQNVQVGIPPKAINLPDVFHTFRTKPSSVTEATEEVAALVDQFKVATAQANRLTQDGGVLYELKYQIGKYMLGEDQIKAPGGLPGTRHVLTFGGKEILSLALQSSIRIDQKALQKEEPEIAARFRKSTSFFVFRSKKGT